MRRVLLAGLVLISGGLWVASGDEPKAPPASPLGRQVAKLKTKYEADQKALKKKLADAKDPEDSRAITFQLKELAALAASDALDLADEGKKDEAGLDAAVFALKLLGEFKITGRDMDKASALLLENFIDSPKIAPALAHMADNGQTGLNFLEAVAEKALNKEVQALAMYYNAVALVAKAAEAEGPTGDEAKIADVRRRATEMFEKAAKQAPEAKVGELALAKAVEGELEGLKIGVGNPVPEIEGTDLDGKKVKLSSYKGRVVLLDIWATWCGPCRAMIPHERELVEKQAGKPFVLLSVSADDEKETLTEFLGKEKMPWNHWFDGAKGPVCKKFKVHAFPTLYLIDAKGVMRKKWIGAPGNEVIDKAIEEFVAEAQKEKK